MEVKIMEVVVEVAGGAVVVEVLSTRRSTSDHHCGWEAIPFVTGSSPAVFEAFRLVSNGLLS